MKTKILTLAILASLVGTGCSNDETIEQPSSFPADGVIRVATTVIDPLTRAGMTTENLNEMGFYVDNVNSTTYSYSNEKMSYTDNNWISETMMLWQNSTQQVQVNAYSPFVDNISNKESVPFSVQADQTTEAAIRASDFVSQFKSVNPNSDLDAQGSIPLSLSHRLSKLVITVKLGTEFNVSNDTETNPITELKVLNIKRDATINLTDGTVTVTGEKDKVKMYCESYTAGISTTSNATAVYQCILIPQTVSTSWFHVAIDMDGRSYIYKQWSEQIFAPNKLYTLTITVGKDQITVGDMTMSDWNKGNGENGENVETE